MSAWRRKFVETFPDLEGDLRGQFTPYTVFMYLLMRCRDAHEQGNEAELKKIYGFAEWCHRHRSTDLQNAAGVSFYEHLADETITLRNMPRYVKPDIFEDVSSLLELRLGQKRFAKLKAEYKKHCEFESADDTD